MSGIVNGQNVDQVDSNNAWIAKNGDDATVGKLDLNNTDVASGTQIANIQREANAINSFVGKSPNVAKDVKPTWTNVDVGTSTDSLKDRADLLTQKLNATAGHVHSGSAGDAPPIPSANVANVPLIGVYQMGTDKAGVTGSSVDVSSVLPGATPSSTSSCR